MSDIELAKKKLWVRIVFRTSVPLSTHSYETEEELVKKFFPVAKPVLMTGVDELGEPINHYCEIENKGDVAVLVISNPSKRHLASPQEMMDMIDPKARR